MKPERPSSHCSYGDPGWCPQSLGNPDAAGFVSAAMKRLVLVVMGALLVGACSGTSEDGTPASSDLAPSSRVLDVADEQPPLGPTGAPAVVGPLGRDYELFASDSVVEIRAGETRQVAVSVNSVGESGGVWTLSGSTTALDDGVVEAVGPPVMLDLRVDRQATFFVELSAETTATPGPVGSYEVLMGPPADDVPQSAATSALISVRVVGAGVVVGPAATSDFVGVGTGGLVFDPTANDVVGDAPLDPASLTVLVAPRSGSLMVTGPGELTYVPGPNGEDTAVYQICDTNGACTNARLWLWQEEAA